MRELYRAQEPSEQDSAEAAERSLQRIRDSLAAKQAREPGD
ncbi:hypothetical protein [Streptomyces katsurahamanus]|nr:hypothetical protein [Streptomyces katsurahamanus]